MADGRRWRRRAGSVEQGQGHRQGQAELGQRFLLLFFFFFFFFLLLFFFLFFLYSTHHDDLVGRRRRPSRSQGS